MVERLLLTFEQRIEEFMKAIHIASELAGEKGGSIIRWGEKIVALNQPISDQEKEKIQEQIRKLIASFRKNSTLQQEEVIELVMSAETKYLCPPPNDIIS